MIESDNKIEKHTFDEETNQLKTKIIELKA